MIIVFPTQAEGAPFTGELAKEAHNARIFAPAQGHPVRGQKGKKLAEGALNMLDVLVIIQVIRIDIQHHRHRGVHFQKAAVKFTGFRHEHILFPNAGAAAQRVQPAADMHGGVQPAFQQRLGDHGGGGGFAVRAANADRLLVAQHQLA